MVEIITAIFPIIAVAVLGYLAANRGYMSKSETEMLSRFTFTIPIPMLLFISTAKFKLLETIEWGFLLSFYISVTLVFVIAVAIAKYLFAYDYQSQSAYGVGAAYSNTTIVGIPVCLQVLGPESMVPLFIIISIQSLFIFSVGILAAERHGLKMTTISEYIANIAVQMIKSPITLALLSGLLVNATGVGLTLVLDETITLLAGAAVPMALFVLGASLNRFELGSQLLETSVLVLLKNVALPAMVYVVATYIFEINSIWTATAVIAAAMPIGISAYAYAEKYGACVAQVASGIFMSTVLSLVTISLVITQML